MGRILLVTILAFLSASGLSAAEHPIATGEWPPYSGAGLPEGGFASAIVRAACTAADLPIDLQFYPWKRAEILTASGQTFATFPYQAIPERQGAFFFSEPLFESYFVIITYEKENSRQDFVFSGPESFTGYRVGVTVGTDAVVLPLRRSHARVEETQTIGQSLEMLRMGRVDFVIEDIAVARYVIDTRYSPELRKRFRFSPEPFGGKSLFRLMVSMHYPNARSLLARFDEGLARIREDGSYAEIEERFMTE